MTPTERAAKVAEIKQELASRSIPGRDRENIRALLAIVAELEAENEARCKAYAETMSALKFIGEYHQ